MTLLILFGPPATGKFTVGQLIADRTNFKLFHNHLIMDGVMQLFGTGTPRENRLSRLIRGAVIDEAADAGMDLIFTYVWNFGQEKGKNNIDAYKTSYESRGGTVQFVELIAPLAVRLTRAGSPDRARDKPHAANAERVAQVETERNFTSPDPFFYPDRYHRIDTTNRTPASIADEIIERLLSVHQEAVE